MLRDAHTQVRVCSLGAVNGPSLLSRLVAQAMTVVGRTRCYPADSSKFSLEKPSTWEPRVLHFAVKNKPWSASGQAATTTHYGRTWLAIKRNISRNEVAVAVSSVSHA